MAVSRAQSSNDRAKILRALIKVQGKPVRLLKAEGYNHFEIAETLANPYGLLGRAMLEFLGELNVMVRA